MKNNKKHKGGQVPHKYIEGIISISPKGIGTVRVKGKEETIEINPAFLNTACHNDSVKILLHLKRNHKVETGEVVDITNRSKKGFAGVIEFNDGIYFLVPSDFRMYKDIIIPQDKLNGAIAGQKVFVIINEWNGPDKLPTGEVYKILGMPMEHNAEMEAIALEKGFDMNFPKEVKNESEQIAKRGITKEDEQGRRDMRSITTFTIDPEDAKDFDDAISVKNLQDGKYEIGIHIADVSNYVKLQTPLDEEARKRGTSVYLVDRTIPMLPEELSNDLCSLKQGVDRLTVSAIFEIDKNGKVYKEWFGRTIINSDKRFTYEEAGKILDMGNGLYFFELNTLNKIAKHLFKKRFEEGAISLEQEEVKFKLDKDGVPISVYTKVRGDTNKLVEEFMLLANKRVAEYMSDKKSNKAKNVFLYRVHDLPNRDKMKDLVFFLKKLGFHVTLKNNIIPSKEINALLRKLEHSPMKNTIHSAVIRTMAKAIYSTDNIGHYGLGFKSYTHFTSPIRRYPDIIVHRLLLDFIKNKPIDEKNWILYEKMSIDASTREKEATEAERSSIKYKQVEYMSTRIGEKYEGNIVGMTEWGFYVEELKTKCEGMISARDMTDDYYTFDKKTMIMKGRKKHKKYTLGDKVKFKVKEVDLNKKNINYVLI